MNRRSPNAWRDIMRAAALIWTLLVSGSAISAEPVSNAGARSNATTIVFNFSEPNQSGQWQPAHDIAHLEAKSDGLHIHSAGMDPFIHGPARNYPAARPLLGKIRLQSARAGVCQIFYFQDHASEEKSVRFDVPGGQWSELEFSLPLLGPSTRLRFDPVPGSGETIVAWIRLEPRELYAEPVWPKPSLPLLKQSAATLRAGELELVHSRDELGAFVVQFAGRPLAIGQNKPLIGYVSGGELSWLDLAQALERKTSVRQSANSIRVNFSCRDADGARWELRQRFKPGAISNAVSITSELRVDRDREIVFAPMFRLFPGAQSFGRSKGQGLFAGLEYLDNEPSSSEADVIGPASKRQVPDALKITFPLMAIQNGTSYLALTWEMQPQFSALFDSPDRLFGSGGHVMGVIFPGSDGKNRDEGSLLPRTATLLRANRPLVLRALLMGGPGQSVVPAIQQYVATHELPPLPKTRLQSYVSLAAHGWLDSKIREANRYRHAIGASFAPHPAADAALYMDWLAEQTTDPALSNRLHESAKGGLGEVPPDQWNSASVGHVRYPAAALVYGRVLENARRAEQLAEGLLKNFEADGSIRYRPRSGALDYGKTHFTNEASGLTAQVVNDLLHAASFSGNKTLIAQALARLRAMKKFDNSVPRGAQTWEVPLHTPDILASAHLVDAYVLGYELTGEKDFLEQARYWAWTGVPFVYLRDATAGPIGAYSTIAVFGATQWKAPVWMGLPVQWCGLVYADALYRLLRHDSSGPWKKIADGITASGIQQTWPVENAELQGLLPDSFALPSQHRNGPAINPGTVQACAAQLFGKPLYDFHAFHQNGLLVHAPGRITQVQEGANPISFQVESWRPGPYFILISGVAKTPSVRVGGREINVATNDLEAGRLVLQLRGKQRVDIATK